MPNQDPKNEFEQLFGIAEDVPQPTRIAPQETGATAEFDQLFGIEPVAETYTGLPAIPTPEQAAAQAGFVREMSEGLRRPENQKLIGRLALEAGGSIAASYFTGGAATAPWLARAAPWAARAGPKAVTAARALAAGLGGAAGAAGAEAFDPTENPLETAAYAFATNMTGEYLGVLAGRVIRGGTRLESGGREAMEAGLEMGAPPTPALVSKSRLIDTIENIAESSFFGGGAIIRAREAAAEAALKPIRSFIASYSQAAGKEAVEQLVQETIIGESNAFRAAAKSMYAQVDEILATTGKPVRVDLTRFIDRLTEASEEFGAEGARAISREVSRFRKLGRLAEDNTTSFADAADIRSYLLAIGRQGQHLIASGAQATGKRLAPLVDDAMEKTAKGISEEAATRWRNANAFWKGDPKTGALGVKDFNSLLLRGLVKDTPRSVYQAMGTSPKLIRQVRIAINDPEAWREVQGQFLWDLFRKSTTAGGEEFGEPLGRRMLGELKRFGDEGLNEFLGPSRVRRFTQLAKNLEMAQASKIGKKLGGGIFIQLMQSGALYETGGAILGASGQVSGGRSALIILGPALAARLLTFEPFERWLTIGIKTGPRTEEAVRALGKLTAIASREGARLTFEAGKPSGIPRQRRISATFEGPPIETNQ